MSSDSTDSKATASDSIAPPKDLFGSKDRARRPTPRPQLRVAKDRAALAMSSGRFSQAFAELVALATEEPGDGQWPLKAGDALRKLGNLPEAIRFYHRAAVVYRAQGHVDRATAVARMVGDLSGDFSLLLALDPGQAARMAQTRATATADRGTGGTR